MATSAEVGDEGDCGDDQEEHSDGEPDPVSESYHVFCAREVMVAWHRGRCRRLEGVHGGCGVNCDGFC